LDLVLFLIFFSLLDASVVAVKTTIASLPFISPPLHLASSHVVLKIKKIKKQIPEVLWKGDLGY
jgi:hypothetical protein